MRTEEKNEKLVKIPESDLLSLVADKLKGKVLFPEKIAKAKAYLKEVKTSAL